MAHFILRFTGAGEKPPADVRRVQAQPGLTVVDESGRMLLVEMPEDAVPALKESLDGWSVSREQSVPLPDPRLKVRKPSVP